MSMFCNKCGAPLEDGARFCNNCGENIERAQNEASQQQPNNTSFTTAPVVPTTTYQQTPPPNQNINQPNPNFNQPLQNGEKPVTVGDWIVTLILLSIPCVGLIMLLVWAFGNDAPKSKQNYCKATLIFMLISFVLSILFIIVLAVAGISLGDNLNDFFDELSFITGTLR